MALNLTRANTFTANTTISSAEVNENENALYNAFSGLEALTSTFGKLKVDVDPSTALEVATKQYVDHYASYRRPRLVYVSATQVDVEVNNATANTTSILFHDGTLKSVTEDTSSTHKYRRFDITATAEFTTGTEDSGLRSGLSEVNNNWYAIYAVKSSIDTDNFVLVGDTVVPTQGNVATLNSQYGANSWVYLGYIKNGNHGGDGTDIQEFTQLGNLTMLRNPLANTSVQSGIDVYGLSMANSASATSVTWTSSIGVGSGDIPATVGLAHFYGIGNGDTVSIGHDTTYAFATSDTSAQVTIHAWMDPNINAVVSKTGAAGVLDLIMDGWIDIALPGVNPLI